MVYLIGIKIPSPNKENAMKFLFELLNRLGWELNGRIYLNLGESLLDNPSFAKLKDHLNPNDVVIFYNSYLSVRDPNEYLALISKLKELDVHMLDMMHPRVNNFDYPLLYTELLDLVTVMRDYMDFLYSMHSNDMNINLASFYSTYDIDSQYDTFIQEFLIATIKRYNFFDDPTYYFSRFQIPQSRQYINQYLPNCSNLPYGWDWSSVVAFNNVVESVKSAN